MNVPVGQRTLSVVQPEAGPDGDRRLGVERKLRMVERFEASQRMIANLV